MAPKDVLARDPDNLLLARGPRGAAAGRSDSRRRAGGKRAAESRHRRTERQAVPARRPLGAVGHRQDLRAGHRGQAVSAQHLHVLAADVPAAVDAHFRCAAAGSLFGEAGGHGDAAPVAGPAERSAVRRSGPGAGRAGARLVAARRRPADSCGVPWRSSAARPTRRSGAFSPACSANSGTSLPGTSRTRRCCSAPGTRPGMSSLPWPELAAMTSVVSAIMNLDEFVVVR